MLRMKRTTLSILLTVSLLAFGLNAAFGKEDDSGRQTFRIGVLARRGTEECVRSWTPTGRYLSEQLKNADFQIVPLAFEEVAASVQAEEIEFIIANSSMYVELQALYGISRLATLKASPSEKFTTLFGGLIFTRSDRSDIASVDSLKGKSFMAADETSFGGWRTAWRELKDKGIDPHRDLSRLEFAGTHDAVVYAVRDGRTDAGVIATPIFEQMVEEGLIDAASFKVLDEQKHADFPYLHSTRLYPNWPFAKLRHTPNEIAEKVTIALLSMSPESPAAQAAQSGGWTVPLDYGEVDECLRELHVGIYKDLGKVTFIAVVQYYKWHILTAIAGFILLTGFLLYALRLNHKLRSSHLALQREAHERIQA